MKRKVFGRYVVADPRVCHGRWTFRGTRVFVADVLEQVGSGMSWDSLIESWNGSVGAKTIAEAVQLAGTALRDHSSVCAL